MAMLLFSLSSSMLLLLNKICLHLLPAPSLLSSLQFCVSAFVVLGMKVTGTAVVDDYEWMKVRPYLIYTGIFIACIYCNLRALSGSNVETLICFRTCVPLVVCVLDVVFMDRELPSLRSATALLVLVAGVWCYVATDHAFMIDGFMAYAWASVYACILAIESVVAKHLVGGHLGFKSMWGPTLYSNSLAALPMFMWGIAMQEHEAVASLPATSYMNVAMAWGLSCILGLGISFTGWRVKELLTATSDSVFGIVNKMATVLVNQLIWEKHASPVGVASLVVCLVGAAFYTPAPLRNKHSRQSEESRHHTSANVSGKEAVFALSLGIACIAILSSVGKGYLSGALSK